jgi:hypothetical protein
MRIPTVPVLAAHFLMLTGLLAAEPKEVTTRYEVELDGKRSVVPESGSKITVGNKSYPINIRELGTKTFEDGAVSFDFPAHFSCLKEVEAEFVSWNFNGDNVYFALFRPDKETSEDFASNYADVLKEEYPNDTRIKNSGISLRLGSKQISGIRFEPSFAGQVLVQEVFNIEVNGQWYVLLLQDNEKKQTSEMKQLREVITKTFRVRKESSQSIRSEDDGGSH